MIFTISKRKWLRDRTANAPRMEKGMRYSYPGGRLLDKGGKMCCLGFCALQLGATKDEIRDNSFPSDVSRNLPGFNKFLSARWMDTNLSVHAAMINDNGNTTDTEKINLLTKLFKKHKHEIVFVP